MQIRDEAKWAEMCEGNTDFYGAGILRYAERWADMMEKRIAEGQALEEIAKATSHEADTEGITGFMYGAAVATLADVWEHGEVLRRWHNSSIAIGDEGEEANKTGGVLNPALLSIGR